MRRHWQNTSFCMGQCVSCGSKRTLDSVPTTPDADNYPGLIPSMKIIHRQNCSSTNFSSIEDPQTLTFSPKPKSSAANFVAAFSKRRITTHRIIPEGESPVHISKSSLSTSHNLSKASFQTSLDDHHGDMKDSSVKSYFRETISSAKKSSTKSVSFTAETTTTTPRKKSFSLFHKTQTDPSSSSSPGFSKVFLRKKPKNKDVIITTPTCVNTRKEKQVCRVKLSPRHGSTSLQDRDSLSPDDSERNLELNTNGKFGKHDCTSATSSNGNEAMGNVSSGSQGLVVDALKTIKPIVKSNSLSKNKSSTIYSNENTKHLSSAVVTSSKSIESPGSSRKQIKTNLSAKNDGDVTHNRSVNSIKEENRLLRLKFFQQDTEDNSSGTNQSIVEDPTSKMSRQNVLGSRSAIPLPKSTTGKAGNSSSIPKLYSVPNHEHHDVGSKSTAHAHPKLKTSQKGDSSQPTNFNSGKWVPASDFFESPSVPATNTGSPQPHSTPPSSSKSSRRSSEPPRFGSAGTAANKARGDVKGHHDLAAERRGTIGYQPKKLALTAHNNPSNIARFAKPTQIPEKAVNVGKTISSNIAIRKPDETRPFYTIGLYQNRPKPIEVKSFGILQSGFHGVSTGIVRQRTQQYQSKVALNPNVVPTSQTNLKESGSGSMLEKKKLEKGPVQHSTSPSPKKPGVIRSATYTIRKHGILQEEPPETQIMSKSVGSSRTGADSRYLTWTVKKTGAMAGTRLNTLEDQQGSQNDEIGSESEGGPSSLLSHMGYPLQHNASEASTSSMGTNEDGIGDHVAISDSEYLIDDEISDQPDLTLTFKDSSVKLSSSSSGESLLSDIMLDHLDLNQERILGDLTSDSAISDISNHKPTSKSSCDHSVLNYGDKAKSPFFEKSSKSVERVNSAHEVSSPASVRTVKHLRSPRRISKPTSTVTKTAGYGQQSAPETVLSRSSCNFTKSPSPISPSSTKYHTESKHAPPKPSRGNVNSQSVTNMSPSNRNKTTKKEQVLGLTVENVNKLHKQYELVDTQCKVDHGSCLPVPFAEELLGEFHTLKDELEKLQSQLEQQEKREREKDELIHRLTSENDHLKSLITRRVESNGNVNSPGQDSESDDTQKERYINSLNYENAAVQTENNNIFNRSVTYPDEDDKYGELVSFRIGRSASLKKKL